MVRLGLAFGMKTLGASAIIALICWPRCVLAQPALSPIYVSVRLAPECQGASDFAGRLLSRTHRLRWAYPGEPGIVFDVAAQPIPMGYAGQLQIRELDGRITQRSVEGTTCDGVINALAFVAAVLVDPAQSEERAPAPLPPPPPAAVPPEPPAHRALSLGLGLTTGFTTATAAAYVQPNIGARVSMAWDRRGLSPWITVGFDQRFDSTATSTLTAAGRSESIETTFGGWNAHMALSPMRWPATGYYSLRPVALFEIGQITSSSSVTPDVTTKPQQSRLWLATGLGASAEARIYSPLAAVADLGFLAPINRWDYYYNTATEVHPFKVRALDLSVRLGLIVKFE
jgi:hypothetical protein